MPDPDQFYYRKALIHNNFKKIVFNIATIADYAGLTDNNPWNLANTVETNILEQLRKYGYIDSYEKVGEDPKASKNIIRRFGADSNENSGVMDRGPGICLLTIGFKHHKCEDKDSQKVY